ncbi:hypothetical protein K439DRAFT_1645172 [Ramaria rubella]|nr:hypothetical protein K439DRAFT_1645172 [Ramaria rubella]
MKCRNPKWNEYGIGDVICSSIIKKTRGNWGTGVLHFHQYCDSINMPEAGCMPAPKIILCLFIANYGAGKVTDDCISNWLTGIHRWHQVHGAPWFGDKALNLVICGAGRLAPESSGCCCLGELTIPSCHSFTPIFHAFTTIHIPWSKTLHTAGDDLHLIDTHSPSSPTSALEHHLASWFMSRCNEVFLSQGLKKMDGHSFRIGGTTWLLLLVWSSAAFLS